MPLFNETFLKGFGRKKNRENQMLEIAAMINAARQLAAGGEAPSGRWAKEAISLAGR